MLYRRIQPALFILTAPSKKKLHAPSHSDVAPRHLDFSPTSHLSWAPSTQAQLDTALAGKNVT